MLVWETILSFSRLQKFVEMQTQSEMVYFRSFVVLITKIDTAAFLLVAYEHIKEETICNI